MFTLNGTLKKDEIKEYIKKDGSAVKKRIIFIEPTDSIFPIEITIEDQSLKLGNIGEIISLNVCFYPFYFENGKRKKANISYYVPIK